ncbi:phosphoserine transaminase [PVC group bacterium (ex Bugula neritina AB1)]|nr:phosphoserine transaminase [PVC group bacterium (ex Bugula neritina AB1)]
MARVFNFSAGPSTLPESVLKKAAEEMLDYRLKGLSVMEMSHRSDDYVAIFENARSLLRELLNLPETHEVLFLQGGASLQFAMVPLNLMKKFKRAAYTNTGVWAKKAIAEAKKYGEILCVGDSSDKNFSYIPETDWENIPKDIDYVHITSNNTIYGTTYHAWPDTGDIPLVVDMSSNILSESMDVSKADLIYAGAQKNIGPSGVTVVIIRKSLLGYADEKAPSLLNYQKHVEAGSMMNTPPCYNIYMAGLVFEWIKEHGGPSAMGEYNRKKAALLYETIDKSKTFSSAVNKKDRSLMNVPFVIGDAKREKAFIDEAEKKGLVNLKGHRSVGGMRASIYNAMPIEGVQALVEMMLNFEK